MKDGVFRRKEEIGKKEAALILKREKHKTVTLWEQFINNHVNEGNRSGEVCFEKE